MESGTQELESTKKSTKFLYAFLVVLVLWGSALVLWNCTKGTWKLGLGDIFDTLNTLFSGLAFGTVVYAILLQREEIALQRLDLKNQLKEMEFQRKAQEQANLEFSQQNETMTIQQFENTFFQMIKLQNQTVEGMEGYVQVEYHSKGLYSKRAIFRPLIEFLIFTYENNTAFHEGEEEGRLKSSFSKFYTDGYDGTENILDHYFLSIYNIIDFVVFSKAVSRERKRFYMAVLVSQLTKNERILLVYQCLGQDSKLLFPVWQYGIVGSLNNYDMNLLPEWVQNLYREKTKDFVAGWVPISED